MFYDRSFSVSGQFATNTKKDETLLIKLLHLLTISIPLLGAMGGRVHATSRQSPSTATVTGSHPEELPIPMTITASDPSMAAMSVQGRDPPWWKPGVDDTWHWQLRGPINTGLEVSVYDIDLFDTPAKVVDVLHAKDIKVICYFSAGSSEAWRTDFQQFRSGDKGKRLNGWEGERWLDVRSQNVRSIMTKRLDLARSKGCDGVEPDNVDGYANDNGLGLTAEDQKSFNRFLATAAHSRGLAIGLKNDVDQVRDLEEMFDFHVSEQCHEFRECDELATFIRAGKPVFNAEYFQAYRAGGGAAVKNLCATARRERIRTLILPVVNRPGFAGDPNS